MTTIPANGRASNHFRDRALEWFSSLAMVVWAIILSQAGDTLAAPNFQEFAANGMSEDTLAMIFAFVGCSRLAVLIINGRWPKNPIARVAGACAGFALWSQIAALFGVSWWFYGVAGTGFGIYALLALAELFSVAWATGDVRYHRN